MSEPDKTKQSAGDFNADSTLPSRPSNFWQYRGQSLTLAVGLLVVLTLFAVDDRSRMLTDLQQEMQAGVQYLATELKDAEAETASDVLGFLGQKLPDGAEVFLLDGDGTLIAGADGLAGQETIDELQSSMIFAQAPISGPMTSAIVVMDKNVALLTEWERIAGATVLAVLLLFIGWRREDAQAVLRRRQSGLELHDLFETLPLGIAHWSDDGKLLWCNSHYRDRLDLGKSDTKPGKPYEAMMRHVTDSNSTRLISDDNAIRMTEIDHGDGNYLLIDERPLHQGGFVSLVTDVSGHRLLEKQLVSVQQEQRGLTQQLHEEKLKAESASRAKTSFLAHLSHDIRTPLNHIIGFADLIAHQTYGPVGDKRYLNYVGDIKDSGEKLLTSFAEILELAQLEGGHLVLRREHFDIAELIDNTGNRFKSTAERAGVTLEIDSPADTTLFADKLCLERMLGNIVENAIQFTPSGGRVKLTSWLGADGVVLEISDTGIGMSPGRLEDLSQPFILEDSAFTRDGGVGLGIAISRAIAELSGGQLAIDSSPAVGTTVAISLPVRAASKSSSANAA